MSIDSSMPGFGCGAALRANGAGNGMMPGSSGLKMGNEVCGIGAGSKAEPGVCNGDTDSGPAAGADNAEDGRLAVFAAKLKMVTLISKQQVRLSPPKVLEISSSVSLELRVSANASGIVASTSGGVSLGAVGCAMANV